MQRNISALASQEFDLVIVGGGIFGICAAWDATLRGLSVALLEKGDWGHATSANHFKVVHGGIRYLQHADIARVRESSRDRSALLRIAPHLVYPLPFAIPTYGHGMQSRAAMRVALRLYDLCTLDRNQGIPDRKRQVLGGYTVARQQALQMFPYLDEKDLTGAAIFYDGQMYNPARLSLAFVRSAVERGAAAANYVEVVGFLRNKQRITGVVARDQLTGNELEVRGRVVLNATGPWAKWLLKANLDLNLPKEPTFSRDAYFIVKRKLVANHALAIQGQTSDPDAVLSRGKRHLFLVPWRDYTLVGVWHVVFHGRPEEFTVTAGETQQFIDEVNLSCPSLQLRLDDVCRWSAGLTLFGENKPGAENLSYGKRSLLIDHAKENGPEGLITLIGVRFTTAPGMAEQAVNLVFAKLGKKAPPSRTAVTPLAGGEIENFNALVCKAVEGRPSTVAAQVIPTLVHNHGTNYTDVLNYVEKNPDLAQTLCGSSVIEAEIVHAVREEMAVKLSDVVLRRTDLGAGSHPGPVALQSCANRMAAELGWDNKRVQCELAEVEAVYPHF